MFINVVLRRFIRLTFFLILLVYISNIDAFQPENGDEEYVDIGVRLTGNHDDQLIADLIAQEKDVLNTGLIAGVDLYHFQVRRKRTRRSKRAINELIEDLKRDERIEYVTIGEALERSKRAYINDDDELIELYKKYKQNEENIREYQDSETRDVSKFKVSFDDKLYRKQWYLENEGQFDTPAKHDINVVPAWVRGYTGRNVLVCVVDDGLDHTHPEIRDNYVAKYSYDLNDLNDPEHDPLPRTTDDENTHGTECAGTAVARANNEVCGVGVAYNANIAGIRVLDGPMTTLLEARALTLFANDTDIKSASWGPRDDGTKMEAPSELVNEALHYSVTQGRRGKGTLFVWASGNGGAADDDCGADGYTSHHNVLSINSINHLGKSVYFGESCPSTLATAYTGGQHSRTHYEEPLPVGIITPKVGGKCTTTFAGTSSAAPLAAGAFALVLEANPELGYRDVMHIVTRTARIPTLSETDDWIINGAGYHVSDKFGFGVLDVGQMIALAQNWKNVEPRQECYHNYTGDPLKLPIGGVAEISLDVKQCGTITNIEHVVSEVSYGFHRRGDVKLTLISPSKTSSELLSYRAHDATDKDVERFPLMTTHKWGEHPEGRWLLRVETRTPQIRQSEISAKEYGNNGELRHFGLRIFGASNSVDEKQTEYEKRDSTFSFVPTQPQLETIYKRESIARESVDIMDKRRHQQLREEREQQRRELHIITKVKPHPGFIDRIIGYINLGIEIIRGIIGFIHDLFSSKKPAG